jgi:hypothetical protein
MDPFNVSAASQDPVLAEFGRLNVRMAYPSDRMAGVELSRNESRQLHEVKGEATYRVLERLMDSEGYQRLAPDGRDAFEWTVGSDSRVG